MGDVTEYPQTFVSVPELVTLTISGRNDLNGAGKKIIGHNLMVSIEGSKEFRFSSDLLRELTQLCETGEG